MAGKHAGRVMLQCGVAMAAGLSEPRANSVARSPNDLGPAGRRFSQENRVLDLSVKSIVV